MATSPKPAARNAVASAAARSGSPCTSRTCRVVPASGRRLRSKSVVVGVAGQPVEHHHLGLERERPSQDAHLGPAFHQSPAQRVGRLIAGDQDGAARVLDVVLEVVQDAAGLAHAAGRDDDARLGPIVQRDALVDLLDVADVPLAEQVGMLAAAAAASRRRSTPGGRGTPRWPAPPSGCPRRSGRSGSRPALIELVQEVDDGLRAADAERRDDQLAAAARRCCRTTSPEPLGRLLDRLVGVAAVGALADEQIAPAAPGRDRAGSAVPAGPGRR